MAESVLHLVKIPLRADKLMEIARRRRIGLRELDDGYLAHCLLRELWQEAAPAPFVLRGRGRFIDVWGYTSCDATALQRRASDFGDPALLAAIDSLEMIASRPVPVLAPGRRVGFHLRACPVVRLSKDRDGFRSGAEIDAFLAECLRLGPDVRVSREEVYRNWLDARLKPADECGVVCERIAVAGFERRRLHRRDQSEERTSARIERPDVRFEGDLRVLDGNKLLSLIRKGVGRHRAFGYGALFVVPLGTPHPRA